jgi:hypothetical protein
MLRKIYASFGTAKYSNKAQTGQNKLAYLAPNKKLSMT